MLTCQAKFPLPNMSSFLEPMRKEILNAPLRPEASTKLLLQTLVSLLMQCRPRALSLRVRIQASQTT